MKLYLKILLAFTAVIAVAVSAVAIAVGRLVESEFRSYNALYSNRAQKTTQALKDYYVDQGSWEGVQDHIAELSSVGKGQGLGQGQYGGLASGGSWTYRLADASGRIVANLSGDVVGSLNRPEKQNALSLVIDGVHIGYLALNDETPLEEPAVDFLKSMQSALWFGIVIAFITALLTAGFLARGFTTPIRTLTQAAESISKGALDSRAHVSGKDEIAQLADSFNNMASTLQLTEQYREAQTADIAHELRNPLAILQGTLEALADGVYQPTQENLQPALDQVHTLNRLVEDLRILALADAGGLKLDRQPVDLKVFLQRVVDAHRESFEGQGVGLNFIVPVHKMPVEADYDRLTQVINNILGNALRYIPPKGSVRIDANIDKKDVVVSVIDNGPGVKPDELPHLFERFWRGDPSRSRETGGSGLGLTIAQRIVQAHNGRIWAETTPGGGLTVRFSLPFS